MAHDEITAWVDNPKPDFERGKYLLKTFSDGRHGLDGLLAVKSSFSLKKLRAALIAINGKVSAKPKPRAANQLPRHKHGQVAGYPDALVELDRTIPIIKSQTEHLAMRKFDLPEGDELKEVALGVAQGERDLRAAWDRLDYFAAFGTEKPGTAAMSAPQSEVEQLRRWLRILPRYIDYTKRHLKSADPNKRAEAERRQKELDKMAEYLKAYPDDSQ